MRTGVGGGGHSTLQHRWGGRLSWVSSATHQGTDLHLLSGFKERRHSCSAQQQDALPTLGRQPCSRHLDDVVMTGSAE